MVARWRTVCGVGLSLALAMPGRAAAYGIGIHEAAPFEALASLSGAPPVTVGGAADVEALRQDLYRRGATHPDEALRARFLARYPTEEGFNTWALKELLLMDPAKSVWGIDRFHEGASVEVLRLLADGSIHPDTDERNMDKLARGADHKPLLLPDGAEIPFDPRTLDMGSLHTLSSQAHAHYGLWRGQRSDSVDVLKTDPRAFSIPPDVETFGDVVAQAYTDLAILARLSGSPGGEYLAREYQGNAYHHLGDVCNQIHTVQVGIYEFFRDATLQSLKLKLFSLGGLLFTPKDFKTIGLGILSNMHTLSEEMWVKDFQAGIAAQKEGKPVTPEVLAAMKALREPSAAFNAHLLRGFGGADPAAQAFGYVLTNQIVEESSLEGAQVYRLTRTFAVRKLNTPRGHFDYATDDPYEFLRPSRGKVEGALAEFYQLQARAFSRMGEALRVYDQLLEARTRGLSPEQTEEVRQQAATRLLTQQLSYLDKAEAERKAWIEEQKAPPAP